MKDFLVTVLEDEFGNKFSLVESSISKIVLVALPLFVRFSSQVLGKQEKII